jgi:hypothetical protein
LQAKDSAIKATVEATKAGELAKSYGTGQYHEESVHHHHHTPEGTTTVSSSTISPIGTTIENVHDDEVA